MCVCVTQLVEVCVDAVGTWDGTHQPGFDEGAPFVDEHSLAADVILWQQTEIQRRERKKKRYTSVSYNTVDPDFNIRIEKNKKT